MCLKANWGMQTERKSARATRNERVTVEVGLKDIPHMVYLQTPPKPRKEDARSIYEDNSISDLQLMAIPPEDRGEQMSSGFITHPDLNQPDEPNVWDTVVSKTGLTEVAAEAQKE
eukprot:UN28944